jgi:hypothetical protein
VTTTTRRLKRGVSCAEGQMVTESMLEPRPPLTKKQKKRMRELRRRWMAKATSAAKLLMMRAMDYEPMWINPKTEYLSIPIGFMCNPPTNAAIDAALVDYVKQVNHWHTEMHAVANVGSPTDALCPPKGTPNV